MNSNEKIIKLSIWAGLVLYDKTIDPNKFIDIYCKHYNLQKEKKYKYLELYELKEDKYDICPVECEVLDITEYNKNDYFDGRINKFIAKYGY